MSGLTIIRGWKGLAEAERGASVAMGNFDGLHRGHQRVIALAARAAGELAAPLGVITFDPHPRIHFRPGEPHFHLTTPAQQARALENLGVDRLYVLPLDEELAQMTDRDFATRVLAEGLGARHVSVGFDNSFGRGRTGTPDTMRAYGAELGFGVSVADPVGDENGKFSSTEVREALRDGRPDVAARILGRPFAIEGVVEKGRQLGRLLGFPTANVALGDYVRPRLGVYATRTRLPDGREVPGVASIGVNPTVGGEPEPRLEVWLFDFNEDIYGQVIETDVVAFLRPEEKFENMQIMTDQVMRDAGQARALLAPEFDV